MDIVNASFNADSSLSAQRWNVKVEQIRDHLHQPESIPGPQHVQRCVPRQSHCVSNARLRQQIHLLRPDASRRRECRPDGTGVSAQLCGGSFLYTGRNDQRDSGKKTAPSSCRDHGPAMRTTRGAACTVLEKQIAIRIVRNALIAESSEKSFRGDWPARRRSGFQTINQASKRPFHALTLGLQDDTRMTPSPAFGRNQEKGRKIKGQKIVIRESCAQIPEHSCFCPRFFCLYVLKPRKEACPRMPRQFDAGNPRMKDWTLCAGAAWQLIRGIASPSVGILLSDPIQNK
jgi:hypothetical protein